MVAKLHLHLEKMSYKLIFIILMIFRINAQNLKVRFKNPKIPHSVAGLASCWDEARFLLLMAL